MSTPELSRRRGESGAAAAIRIALVAALLTVVIAGAGVVWYQSDSGDTEDPNAAAPSGAVQPSEVPGIDLPAVAPAEDVLTESEPADAEAAAAYLRPALSKLVASRALGRHVVVQVSTPGTARPIWTSGVPTQVTPASTMKLVTTLAALDQLGPDHRFTTTVVEGARRGQIVLVGGGDPLLTDRRPKPGSVYPVEASLASLAAQTARDLREQGRTRVSLVYDASLFTGPAVNPTWPTSYITESIVAPISALWVDEGRATPGLARRVPDPAATAADRFAGQLQARGIKVQATRPGKAPDGAAALASEQSAPLAAIVQHVLETSDNEGAEVLFRQAAIAAGEPGSFAGGSAAVTATLKKHGIGLKGAAIYDGSGLSRSDLLPISTLVQVLHVAAEPDGDRLRAVVSTLPVAGFSGSLDYRFVGVAPAGLGQVRAKTGTLTGVHGLAGVVTTRLGNVLLFAAVADRVPVPRTLAARAQLDRIAAALASCRC